MEMDQSRMMNAGMDNSNIVLGLEDNSTIATYSFCQQQLQQQHLLEWYQRQQQQQQQQCQPTATSMRTRTLSTPYRDYIPTLYQQQQHPNQWQQQQQQQQVQQQSYHCDGGMNNQQLQYHHHYHQQFQPQQQFHQQLQQQQEHLQARSEIIHNHDGHTVATRTSPAITLPTVATPTKKVFYPPLLSSSVAPLTPLGRAKPKVHPGRLFVRINDAENNDKLSFHLGEFTIAIKYTEIEPDIVERARKRLTKRANKETHRRKQREQRRRWMWGDSGGTNGTKRGEVYELGKKGKAIERRDDVNEFGSRKNAAQEELVTMMMEEPRLAYLEITHNCGYDINNPTMPTERTVWSSSPGLNFVGASSLSSIDIQSNDNHDDSNGDAGNNGTTMMIEQFNRIYSIQTVDCMRQGSGHGQAAANNDADNVVISGQLGHEISPLGELLPSKWNNVRYTIEFSLTEGCTRGLRFTLRVEGGGVCDGGGAVGMKKNKMSQVDGKHGEVRDTGSVVELDYTVNSAHLFLKSEEDESYFGLGARMSRPNLRGLEVHVCHPTTSSSSSGRSSGGRNGYSTKSTNSSSTMPHFITSSGTSLHLHNTEPSIFDFTQCCKRSLSNSSWYSIRVPCSVMEGTFLVGSSLLHACELHTSVVGRAPLIPRWAQERGIFVGLTGGTLNVHQVCSAFFKHNTLIAGVLIKDWTGVKCNLTSSLPTGSTGLIGGGKYCGNNTMWYNWVLERAHYPKWQSLVDSLERRGISVGLYICPHLEEIPKHLNSGRRHLFAEVQQDDFFVKKKRVNNGTASATGKSAMSTGETTSKKKLAGGGERKGGSNQVQDNAVVGGTMMYNQFKRTKCGILDLTNFNATSWFKQAVREEVFSYAGASFWMTDMGIGGPPVDGVYTTPNPAPDHSVIITTGMAASEGESKTSSAGLSFHNSHAEKWAKVNRDILSDAGREGDAFFIMDAAYSSTATHAGCTCLGDYIADFCNDGCTGGNGSDILRAVLNGLLNGGFSGLTNGHCAVNLSVPRCLSNAIGHTIDSRSREMICRWLEMTAFTALFRTHDGDYGARESGGKGSLLSAHDDEVVMRSLARWSHVFVALSEYRLRLLNEASFKGYPVVRHPMLHFPNDAKFAGTGSGRKDDLFSRTCSSTFMMGDLIYVAPVLKCGVVKSKVYLPAGAWTHLWSGDEVAGPHNFGKIVEVPAPIGEPPVFIRDCDTMNKFVAILRKKRIIKTNKTSPGMKSSLISSMRRRIKQ